MARRRNERDRGMHDAFAVCLGSFLDINAGLGGIALRRSTEIAPSVRHLLADYHKDTVDRLWNAPADSRPQMHRADGTVDVLDEDGWVCEPEPDGPVIDVEPISVSDTAGTSSPARSG
ncbi:hypothetical protein [Nocardia brasiliensis]|uniref:Uncharacterized protein n=1 Tax=Nocardia brasiliensis (strain ATCC 700358 / HUJEG-1) TaxID=1133849 RepID=K0EXM4_NOCB7|nr:hypothetical protein [Nocardia brasiliensis]AFU04648.1 hypothetical protein O3I_033495 [Nocardia brasiliensis ATCC 700358]OCF88369.1 hypothetical protein AW168_22040 [Nocardia brasiliensis]